MIIYSDKFKASADIAVIAMQKMVEALKKGFKGNRQMHRSRGKISSLALTQELMSDDEVACVVAQRREAFDDLCASTTSRDERNDKNYLNIHNRKKKGSKRCY